MARMPVRRNNIVAFLMDPNSLIDKEEISRLVPSCQVEQWVVSLLERYYSSRELIDFIRLKKGVTQELLEELLPLGKYASSYYKDSNVFLQFYPGTKNSFDADFVDFDGNLIERIEVTMAINGMQSRIQSEAINTFGHSCVYHTPKYTGSVKNRIISEPECKTIGSEEIIQIQAGWLNEAYCKKHKKLHKYPNATLLIGMDIPLFMEWEYQKIMDMFTPKPNTFKKVVCVNTSSNHSWRLV